MVAGNTEETALGSARGRFFEGLPRKAMELSGAVELLTATPSAEAPRDDMLRRLNALYASALLFRNDALACALQECIERLDEAREQRRPLSSAELELLASLVHRLPELRDEPENGEARAVAAELSARAQPYLSASLGALSLHSESAFSSAQPSARSSTASEQPSPERGAREPLLQRVLEVCVLAPPGERESLAALLRAESLRVSLLDDVDQLLALAREDPPDVVLAEEQLAHDSELAMRMRNEAHSDFTPIVLYQSADSAEGPRAEGDARVLYPFRSEQLLETIGRATGTLIATAGPARLGELTVSELADRVAADLRRALVDDAVEGRTRRVAIGREAEVLSVAYNAIAELRAAMVRDSGGEVRFAARPADRGPAVIVGTRTSEAEVRLLGRRVLLVEDDTAVVLLLANQLREQGATVHELTDGSEALAAARRERPDLVIAGSRVPGLDAFELSRALAREPLLADVPLLLLPPKEQLLTRAKDSGSVGLSPVHADQVVASAAALLLPRSELEERLREADDVRGSLEGTGVIALLRSVRRTRPDARVCIRDAWNLFECELRDGRLAQVTRTACDGSFVRNDRALPQLLGTRAGRFSVAPADSPMKAAFEGTLDEVLTRGARTLAAELDAVSGARLARVARVVFDEDAYALLLTQTPPAVREMLERLHAGEPPTALAHAGGREELIEPLLLDLMRRGALRAVVGIDGEDLIVEAARVREGEQPTELASPLSLVPPPPNPVISVLTGETRARESERPASEPEAREKAPGSEALAQEAAQTAASVEVSVALGVARARESSISDASELAAAAAEERRSRSTLAAWTVALLALGAVAFFVAREPEGGIMPVEALGAPRGPAEPASPASAREGVASSDGFTIYDHILATDVSLAADEALLMIDERIASDGVRVWLDGRELPARSLEVALSAGDHELAVQRGDAISYRYLTAQPGKTWVLREP